MGTLRFEDALSLMNHILVDQGSYQANKESIRVSGRVYDATGAEVVNAVRVLYTGKDPAGDSWFRKLNAMTDGVNYVQAA